ncbi:MAG: hypothetical protein U0Q19_09275 [Kineosporiaceae bacterium]
MGAPYPPLSAQVSLGGLYSPPRTPMIVDVPETDCLARSGSGLAEGNLAWAEAVDVLRRIWPTLQPTALPPPPLEVLWSGRGESWTLLLTLPAAVTGTPTGPTDPTGLNGTRQLAGCEVRRMHEGWCAQLMYYGARNRQPSLARLDRFIERQGYRPRGPAGALHEIFLDDGASTPAPRVILRRRVQPAG